MTKSWSKVYEEWLKRSSLLKEVSEWAINAINANKKKIEYLENILSDGSKQKSSSKELEEALKDLKRSIKNEMARQENELDDICLNTSSYIFLLFYE